MKLKKYPYILGFVVLSTQQIYAGSYFTSSNQDFKRYSISFGWLHAHPTGKANDVQVQTAVNANTSYAVGDVSTQTVLDAIDRSTTQGENAYIAIKALQGFGLNGLPAALSGNTVLSQPTSWSNPNTGLEVDDIDTVGLLFNYYVNDNVSIEIKGGFPPKVKAKGIGQVNAPVKGHVNLPAASAPLVGTSTIPVAQQIPVTNLEQSQHAVEARAWLPAIEAHYQFGQSGINKFRPYIGAGVLYGHLQNIKLNTGVQQDLILAGHRVQNILDGRAGDGLAGATSSANPVVKVKAKDSFSPIVTLGFNYDFNPNWFGVASVSYSKMDFDVTVDVHDSATGNNLIKGTTKVDVDPIITYLGIGYRF